MCLVYDEKKVLVQEKTGTKYEGGLVFPGGHVEEEEGTRYIVLLYKTDQFEGELKNSREGKVFWLDRNDISSANLIWNMRELLEIFETDQYSEFFFQAGKENVGRHNLLG